MFVKYSEYYENIPDPDTVGTEGRGITLGEQINQLATAVAEYFASGHVPGGTLPTTLSDIPIWPEQGNITPKDGLFEVVVQDYEGYYEQEVKHQHMGHQ